MTEDRPGPLVSVAWLRAHLTDPDLIIVHVSPTRRIYNRRHVPGAVFCDLHRQLGRRGREEATGDVDRTWLLPTREDVEAALVAWGAAEIAAAHRASTTAAPEIAADPAREAADRAPTPAARAPRVVFCDDVGKMRQAIRGYWLLRLYRYPASRVHVLDGALPAWHAAGAPETAEVPAPAPVRPARPVRLGALDPDLIAFADQVVAWSAEATAPGGPTRILDVRSADEFVGIPGHGALRGGRIPGARGREFSDLLRPDNTLRSVPEILGLMRGSGVDPTELRVTYCQGGVRAALAWFALHELAGLEDVRPYAGSWEEWGNRADVPIDSDVVAVPGGAAPERPPSAAPDRPAAATPALPGDPGASETAARGSAR